MSPSGRGRPGSRSGLRLRGRSEENTAAGIYGTIVAAGVMAAAHASTAAAVIVGVAFTLVVYWAAERYARLVADRIHRDRPPTWAEVRAQLRSGWEMVTVSTLPLLVLALFALLGAQLGVAVLAGLLCSTLMLCLAGWEIGSGGRLSVLERGVLVAVAGGFGVLMIVLKSLLH